MTKRNLVTIKFSEDEAVVLFEWLHRVNTQSQVQFTDQAERRVLWDLEASLESSNQGLFAGDYAERVKLARERVRDQEG